MTKFRFTPEQVKTIRKLVSRRDHEGWKGVSEAARAVDVSRETITQYLRAFPKEDKPRAVQPQYASDLKKTKAWTQLQEFYGPRSQSQLYKIGLFLKKAFPILNRKDPMYWELEDFKRLVREPIFFDLKRAEQYSTTPKISSENMVALRGAMRAFGHGDWETDPYFETKKLKRLKGQKQQWWLRKDEIQKIVASIDEYGTAILLEFACYTGGRISSYLGAVWQNIDLELGVWYAVETKTGTPVERVLNDRAWNLIKSYHDFMQSKGLAKPTDKVFPRGEEFYTRKLKEGGMKSGLCSTGYDDKSKRIVNDLIHGFRLSWHMTRHTFASAAAQANVPLQYIMKIGGWTDSGTLLTYYAAINPAEVKKEMEKINFE